MKVGFPRLQQTSHGMAFVPIGLDFAAHTLVGITLVGH